MSKVLLRIWTIAALIAVPVISNLVVVEPSYGIEVCAKNPKSRINMRSGPGQQFRVILALRSGESIDINGAEDGKDGYEQLSGV